MVVSKKRQDSSIYDYIFYFSIIVIILSALYMGFKFTGNAVSTSTAVVNVTISTTTAINFTTNFLNLGTGVVNLGSTSASVDSDGICTGGTWAPTPSNFTLQNIGNTNASLTLSMGKTAAQFIGGTSPVYQFKFGNNEAGSCVNSTAMGVWTATSTSNISLCSIFLMNDASDTINIGVKVTIPSDSLTGTQTDTFTATATGI